MLPSRITPYETTNSPEDIFSSAITTIFPDDTINSHGTPGSYVTYKSPSFGDIRLQIPQHAEEEQERKLFAHHLWNAGVLVAERVERASQDAGELGGEREGEEAGAGKVVWDRESWDVRGKSVLELGAGTALPSLICALVGARSITITDHPSSPALTTNTISQNIKVNLKPPLTRLTSVYGYVWGTSTFYSPTSYGKPISTASPWQSPSIDRIIIADCLWMPSQHVNLIKTILNFLPASSRDNDAQISPVTSNEPDSAHQACALVVAGFHTGRRIVANFFSLATDPLPDPDVERPVDPPWNAHASSTSAPLPTSDSLLADSEDEPSGSALASAEPVAEATAALDADADLTSQELSHLGRLRLASIFEVDVDLNTRPWMAVREGETKWEAKRWCVVGVLVRR